MIDKKYPEKERGDVLVFLNGISEITTVAEALKEYAEFSKKWIILILHRLVEIRENFKLHVSQKNCCAMPRSVSIGCVEYANFKTAINRRRS
jgi:hypothetical protein